MSEKREIRMFYQAIRAELRLMRDAKGRVKMEYRDVWCPTCGRVTSHRVEYRPGLELRHCTGCGVGREYRL